MQTKINVNNMKNIISTLVLFLAFNVSFGQKEYDNLRILYADGNYEKLVKTAEKYTNDDKTKKDPVPYLWLSKGLYKMHVTGNASGVYKNAYKESINAVGKSIKYDKTGSVFSDPDNKEYLDLLQGSLIEQIVNELMGENYKRAYSWSNSYKKLSQNLIGQIYLDGASKYKTGDKSTGMSLWRTADGLLKDVTSIDDWTKGDKDLLRIGVIQTAECYVSMKKVDLARALLNKIAQWYEDDAIFKDAYNEIVN